MKEKTSELAREKKEHRHYQQRLIKDMDKIRKLHDTTSRMKRAGTKEEILD